MRFALINPSWQAPPARITARFKASNLRWLRQAILRRITRKRPPCLVAKLWVWKEDEGTKFLQHFKDRLLEQIEREREMTGSCLVQLVEDATKTLWHCDMCVDIRNCQAMKQKEDTMQIPSIWNWWCWNRHPFFGGVGTWNSLVRFHHPTIREHQWHQRWPKAPWESSFERIQVHFYPRQSHLRSCATFCHVFRVFAVAEDRSWITTPTPLGKCTFFFEPK